MTLMCRYGVPPSGGGAHANTMIMEIFNALERTDAAPTEAGTPNIARLAKLETEIQQHVKFGVPALAGEGMKELEGMLK